MRGLIVMLGLCGALWWLWGRYKAKKGTYDTVAAYDAAAAVGSAP